MLSVQQLVDCSRNGNHGCNGGHAGRAYDYILANGGISSASNYRYSAKDGVCNRRKASLHTAKIKGYGFPPWPTRTRCSEPCRVVSVRIDAREKALQFYSGGVFTGSCGTNLNHLVILIGYGTTKDGRKYWLVRNSWGTDWGDKGYVKIQRGSGIPEGKCGIAMEASYPIA